MESNGISVGPITFVSAMARATWEGRKTNTRRVWQLPRGMIWYADLGGEREGWYCDDGGPGWWHVDEARCPYGRPGDLLYVKEAWRTRSSFDALPGSELPHAAHIWYPASDNNNSELGRVRSARFMPRRFSRMTLRIKSVRVERIQEISEGDAIAEGLSFIGDGCAPYGVPGIAESWDGNPRNSFRALWDMINVARGYGWDANPWVWAIAFEVIRKNVDLVLQEAA